MRKKILKKIKKFSYRPCIINRNDYYSIKRKALKGGVRYDKDVTVSTEEKQLAISGSRF